MLCLFEYLACKISQTDIFINMIFYPMIFLHDEKLFDAVFSSSVL